MGIKFANNASSTLATGISSGATSITVATGDGALFPAAGGSDWFYCTLIIAATNTREIVKVTSRSGDVFTVTRAQEGTTATAFSTGDLVRLQLTAAALNEFVNASANNTFSGTNTFSAATTFAADVALDAGVKLVFEGATADAYELTLQAEDPTADVTVTVPATTGALASLAKEQAWTAQQTPMSGTLTDGATIDWSGDTAGQSVKVTLAGNRTMNAPTNINEFAAYVIRVIQDATGSRTLAWNSAFKFAGGTAPTLTTTASAVDVFTFIGGASNVLYCVGQTLDVK